MKKQEIFSNVLWRFAERCGAQLVAFIVSIVLARILDPDAYGTVALITVFTTILQVFVDSGLGNALIQKKDADNVDFSTVFFTNILFCSFLYGLLFVSAPYVAVFYGDADITAYLRVLGLTVVISGMKNVQQAYVSRYLLFKKFFLSTLCGTVIAGFAGVLMALNGYGVWALVAQQVINLAIDTFLLWITVKWRPELTFSFGRLRVLFSFGWKLLASSLIDTIYTDIRQLLIGKLYSSADLAQYNRGRQFPSFLVNSINTSIDSVLLPVLSQEQEHIERIKDMTRKSIKVSTYIIVPLMMGLTFTGDQIVGLILTEKWLPSVFYMRIFCLGFMFRPVNTANLNAIKAVGRSDVFLKLEIWKKVIGFILLFATMYISVEAMAISLLVNQLVCQLINAWPNKKLMNYGYLEQLKDIMPSLCLALIMGLCVYPVRYLGLSYFYTLCIQIPLGCFLYIAGSAVLKIDAFTYALGILKPVIAKIKRKKREQEKRHHNE